MPYSGATSTEETKTDKEVHEFGITHIVNIASHSFTIVCARNVDFLRGMGVSMAQISTLGMKRLTPSVLVNESSERKKCMENN